jgi:hypothetical protein
MCLLEEEWSEGISIRAVGVLERRSGTIVNIPSLTISCVLGTYFVPIGTQTTQVLLSRLSLSFSLSHTHKHTHTLNHFVYVHMCLGRVLHATPRIRAELTESVVVLRDANWHRHLRRPRCLKLEFF